jgi:hypothetical protein
VFYSFLSLIIERGDKEMETTLMIYCLYSIDTNGQTKFCGRYASKHRAEAAARGLGLRNYFFETDAKEDEYGSHVNINAALKSTVIR